MAQSKSERKAGRQITPMEQEILRQCVCTAGTLGVRDAMKGSLLDEERLRAVIRGQQELQFVLRQATVNFLAQFPVNYPVLTETEFLKPVRVATIPARTKLFDAKEFYLNGNGRFQISETFADNLLIREWQMPLVAHDRPYVALRLKKRASTKEVRMELPNNHLSTLEDIGFFLQAQRSRGSGFLLDEFSPRNGSRTNIFLVEGRGNLIFAVRVTAVSGYADYWSGDGWWSITEDEFRDDDTWHWNEGCTFVCPGTAEIEPVE